MSIKLKLKIKSFSSPEEAEVASPVEELLWNGSFLGQISKEQIVSEFAIEKNKYWSLNIEGQTFFCLYKKIKSLEPCIIDECKGLFSLPKIGTHSIKYKSSFYLLMNVKYSEEGEIIEEDLLNSSINPIIEEEDFKEKIRRIYIFRDTFSLSSTFDSSLTIRSKKHSDGYEEYYPLSLYEPIIKLKDISILPGTVMARWFTLDRTPPMVLAAMLSVKNGRQIGYVISKIRSKMEEIINRIAPDMKYIETFVIARITERLCAWADENNSIPCALVRGLGKHRFKPVVKDTTIIQAPTANIKLRKQKIDKKLKSSSFSFKDSESS